MIDMHKLSRLLVLDGA